MKKSKKIALIASAVCILAGLCMATTAWFSLQNADPSELSTMQFEEKSHTITEPFNDVIISTINSSIEILPSSDGICRVVCDDNEKLYHQVFFQESEDGTALHIVQHDEWEWYETLGGLHWDEDPILTVYLPQTEYEILDAVSGSGDITVAPDFRFRTLSTRSTSGNTALTGLKAENLLVNSSSGDISLRSVQVAEAIVLENVSGFTRVENLTASELNTASSSGDTVLENITSEYLNMRSVSGAARVYGSNFSNTSYFETSSGSIEIVDSLCGDQTLHSVSGSVTLQNVQANAMELRTTSGDVKLWEVHCEGNTHFETVSGEIMFTGLDAANLDFVTSSGVVSGSLLTPKNFITQTSSGYVEVPYSDPEAGTCSVQTVSGDIIITIQP